jgi:hypothetical protein
MSFQMQRTAARRRPSFAHSSRPLPQDINAFLLALEKINELAFMISS